MTVIAVAPSPSETTSSLTVSAMPLGASSSSLRVMVALPMVVEPDVPPTVTVSGCSSQLLAVGSRLKEACALVAPIGSSMSNSVTGANLTRPAFPEPETVTATVLTTPKRVAPCTVAVTVMVWVGSLSPSDVWLTLRLIAVGVASSSVTCSVAALTVTPVRIPLKATVASASSTLSAPGTTVTVWVPVRIPAGIVIWKLEMVPTPTAPATRAALTVTVLATPKREGPSTAAVTTTLRALPVAPSEMDVRDSDSVTDVGASSLSFTVTATDWSARTLYLASEDETLWVMVAVRLLFGLSMLSSTPYTVIVCASQSPGEKVSVSVAVRVMVTSGPSSRATPPLLEVSDTVTLDAGWLSSATV